MTTDSTYDIEADQVHSEVTVLPSKCVPGRWYYSNRYGRVLCCGSGNPDEWTPAFAIRNHKGRTELRFLADTTDLLRVCEQAWKNETVQNSLVYLATPYSHHDHAIMERRFEVVNVIAARLMRDGIQIYSPISHTHPIAVFGEMPRGWDFWKKYDRAILSVCCRMIVVRQDGWKESIGVAAEIGIAMELGLPVEFIDP